MFEEGVLKFLWEETDFLCELPQQIIEAIEIELYGESEGGIK
tara:strand:- start:289 stop:414 length:126 start_codon:yes stop_codon:yes gene_type:complete